MTSDIFFGTRGSRTASIRLVGESWGSTENRHRKPFVGESGQDLDKLLAEARIKQTDCFWTNVVSEQPANNDVRKFFHTTAEARSQHMNSLRGLYPHQNIRDGLANLKAQISAIKPKLI